MNKKFWSLTIFLIFILGALALRLQNRPAEHTDHKENALTAESTATSYWTCPMHPHIHSDKPGQCPICHMKLVEVHDQPSQVQKEASPANAGRSPINISDAQMALMGVQKHIVERMDLTFQLPISGRFLSSQALAFQVYESDLRYIRPGLKFRGESAYYPDEEVTGVISSVDSLIDPSSRTVRVIGRVQTGPKSILSETSFSGIVEIELENRIAIPETAVLHTGTGDLVYMFGEGQKLHAMNVKLGLKTETYYEVLKGLKEGDVISSGPNFLIDSEARIRGTPAGSHDKAHH